MQKNKKSKRVFKFFALITTSILMTGSIFSLSTSCSCSSKKVTKQDLTELFKQVGDQQHEHGCMWYSDITKDANPEMNNSNCYGGVVFSGEGYRVNTTRNSLWNERDIKNHLAEDLNLAFPTLYPDFANHIDAILDTDDTTTKDEYRSNWHKIDIVAKEDSTQFSGSFYLYYYLNSENERTLSEDFKDVNILFSSVVGEDKSPIWNLENISYRNLKDALAFQNPDLETDAIHFQYYSEGVWLNWDEQQPDGSFTSTKVLGPTGANAQISKDLWDQSDGRYVHLRIEPNRSMPVYAKQENVPIEFTIELYRPDIEKSNGWQTKWNQSDKVSYIVNPNVDNLKTTWNIEYGEFDWTDKLKEYPNSWTFELKPTEKYAIFKIDKSNPYFNTNASSQSSANFAFGWELTEKINFYNKFLSDLDFNNAFYQTPNVDDVRNFIELKTNEKYKDEDIKIYWNEIDISVNQSEIRIQTISDGGTSSSIHYEVMTQVINYKLIN